MSREESLVALRSEISEHIGAYNEALQKNNFDAMVKAESSLKEVEKEYAKTLAAKVYKELGMTDNPMLEAVKRYGYSVASHTIIRENGDIVGMELTEKDKQIDLVAMAKYNKIDCKWQYMVEKFNQLLCLRAAQELKLTKSEIEDISKSFYMQKVSRAIDIGETPTSNTQLGKQLQSIVDAMVFEDDGKGKNKYKVNSRDVAYILMCSTQKGKSALTVKTQKHQTMHRLIMDVEHRIVLNKKYGLDYKVSKDLDASTHTTGGKVEVVSEASKSVEAK